MESDSLIQTLKGTNLYLVGMMGSGKSQTGPYLAKELGYSFVDMDLVIEEVTSKSISKIFEEEGEKVFRGIEAKVLQEIGQYHSLVVATGGGVVISSDNWGVLRQGIVIWIDPEHERLFKRLELDTVRRPLLESADNAKAFFESICDKRKAFYAESDLHISVQDESPEQVSGKILENLFLRINAQKGPSV